MKEHKDHKVAVIAAVLLGILIYFLISSTINAARAERTLPPIKIENEVTNDRVCYYIGKYYLEKKEAEAYSDSIALKILSDIGCYYPDIIMAQIEIESAKATSKIAHSHNNIFGMKKAFKRPTCRNYTLDHKGYAHYYNWQLSLIDRLLWDFWKFPEKPTRSAYLAELQKTYAEDPAYLSTIKTVSQKYQ